MLARHITAEVNNEKNMQVAGGVLTILTPQPPTASVKPDPRHHLDVMLENFLALKIFFQLLHRTRNISDTGQRKWQ
jgi:hypothetical protein